MSRAYPIWHEVYNCSYKSNKSYGNKRTGEVQIKVGSGKANSYDFVRHIVTKREGKMKIRGKEKKVIIFKFSVDGVILKEMIFENKGGKGRAGKLLKTRSALTRMKGLK